jgi:heptosyltransferase II
VPVKTFLHNHNIINKAVIYFAGFIFSLLKKKSRLTSNNNVIAIIALQRLGDSVFTIPSIKAVFNYYKGYKIFILCYKGSKEIFLPFFPEDAFVEIPKNLLKYGRLASGESIDLLNKINPDIIFDLNITVLGASFIFGSKAAKKIGSNELYYKHIYDKFIPQRTTPHLMDMYLDIVQQEIPLSDREELKEFKFDVKKGSDKILIHPFAGWKEKEWDLLKFIELAGKLIQNGYKVSLVFEKGKLPEDVLNEIKIPFIETGSIAELIENIKDCFLFISNDSGPLYIAGSRGKATFSIYGPTNPDYSLLPGKHHGFIRNQMPCLPDVHQYCIKKGGFTCPSNECMKTLPVETVFQSLSDYLKKLNSDILPDF